VQTLSDYLDFEPKGCWPSEGSISEQTLEILDNFGFDWAASGGSVLHNSLALPENEEPSGTHHPFKLKKTYIACFFRDDGLSDLIGFEYSKWHADDAVADLIHHLKNIAAHEPTTRWFQSSWMARTLGNIFQLMAIISSAPCISDYGSSGY
jgi:alpha-amylase/alpha-mannosidase (GH57 family)